MSSRKRSARLVFTIYFRCDGRIMLLQAICSAFQVNTELDRKAFILCALSLKTPSVSKLQDIMFTNLVMSFIGICNP